MVRDGICEFCGQANLIDECDCPQAKQEKKKQQTLNDAKQEITFLFSHESEAPCVDILCSMAEHLIDGEIKSVKIDFDGYTGAALKLDAKDNIKIEHTYKSKTSAEVKQNNYI